MGVCFSYRLHSIRDRKSLWTELSEYVQDYKDEILVLGDFNVIFITNQRRLRMGRLRWIGIGWGMLDPWVISILGVRRVM